MFAEENKIGYVWADPEAAKIVFESGLKIKKVGWEISNTYAVLGPEGVAELRAIGMPLAHFCIDIQRTLQPVSYTHLTLPTTPYV